MKQRVFVAMAIYDQIWPEVVDCITHSAALTIYGPHTRIRSSNIDLARSELAGRFLDWKGPNGETATHMMIVDSDVWWDDDLISKLLDENVDIICAAYRARVYPCCFHFVFTKSVRSIHECPLRDGKHGPIMQICNTGIGATLIRRNVIEKMYAFYGEDPNLVYYPAETPSEPRRVHLFQKLIFESWGKPRGFGEDYGFQRRAELAGFKIECLTNVRTYHAGIPGNLKADVLDGEIP